MKTTKILLMSALMSALLASFQAYAADTERKTVSINDKVPTAEQVADALFPKEVQALKAECAAAEKAGMRCQSRIPKSSLDSVLVTFPRGSAAFFLPILGSLPESMREMFAR